MNNNSFTEKPRLVSAGQGFSILNTVNYKGRFLYSKYSPDKAVIQSIENLKILEGTLIVICSPCLWYGLKLLLQKLPAHCNIIALEADGELFSLAQEQLKLLKNSGEFTEEQISSVSLFSLSESHKINEYLNTAVSSGTLRRALRVDFSAGVSFAPSIYEESTDACEEYIARFWKNRVTLVKMGRLFSRNIFKNLSSSGSTFLLEDIEHSVAKPVIVFGAGESSVNTIQAILNNDLWKHFFILATDASLSTLKSFSITPDAVVGLEAQSVIEKAYIGSRNSRITLITDIASRPQIKDILGGNTVFFASKFADAEFLKRIKDCGLINDFIPAMGSVGLAAVYIALRLRSSEKIPVFVTGLDFSFTTGATHAKGAPAHLQRLFSSLRTISVENYDASFKEGAFSFIGKNKKRSRSDVILKSYADSFKSLFEKEINLYDAGCSGIELGIPFADSDVVLQTVSSEQLQSDELLCGTPLTSSAVKKSIEYRKEKMQDFYRTEYDALTKIKDLLSSGDKSEYRDMTVSLSDQLYALLEPREYLYLHFPDGYKLSTDLSFLKRIRAEIDFFLKDIEYAANRG